MKRFVCRQIAFVGFFINFAFCYSESATIEIYSDIFAWEELLKADNYSSYDIKDNGFDTGIFRVSFSKNHETPAYTSVRGETTIDFKNIRQDSNQDGIIDIFDPSFNYQDNFYGAQIQNYFEGSIHIGYVKFNLHYNVRRENPQNYFVADIVATVEKSTYRPDEEEPFKEGQELSSYDRTYHTKSWSGSLDYNYDEYELFFEDDFKDYPFNSSSTYDKVDDLTIRLNSFPIPSESGSSTKLDLVLEKKDDVFHTQISLGEANYYIRINDHSDSDQDGIPDLSDQTPRKLLSNSTYLDNGWHQHEHFGTFHEDFETNWYYHVDWGWIYVPSWNDDGTWFYRDTDAGGNYPNNLNSGWMWTSTKVFPYVFSYVRHGWICPAEGMHYLWLIRSEKWEFFNNNSRKWSPWKTWEDRYKEWLENPEPFGGKDILEKIRQAKVEDLTSLDLSNSQITDITPLYGLKRLTELSLSENKINEIKPLEKLVNLEKIHLSRNEISDLSALSNLKNLRELHLDRNKIEDISFLHGLNQLNYLNLEWNPLKDHWHVVNKNNPKIGIKWGVDYSRWIEDPEEYGGYETLQKVKEAKIYSRSSLTLQNTRITNLTPLSTLTELESLYIYDCNVSELSALSLLTKLTNLTIHDSNISDLSPLSGLENLKYLELHDHEVIDLSPLSELHDLKELRLEEGKLEDLSPIKNLSNLEALYLSNNQIVDLSALASLNNLLSLSVSGNQIDDLGSLQNLTALSTLILSSNNILDLTPLSKLTNLRELALSENLFTDVSPIEELSNLENLWLIKNYLTASQQHRLSKALPETQIFWPEIIFGELTWDENYENWSEHPDAFGGLEILNQVKQARDTDATQLTIISFSNQISNILPLYGLSKLEGLYIKATNNNLSGYHPFYSYNNTDLSQYSNYISDLSPLSEMKNLKALVVSDNNISNLAPLEKLTDLEWLNLSDNNISDISPLSNLVNLKGLEISFNNISDLSPLAKLSNLENLNFIGNSISDLSPIKNLTKLTSLNLARFLHFDNNISDIEPLAGLVNLTHLDLSGQNISDITPLMGLSNLQILYLDLNNTQLSMLHESLPNTVINGEIRSIQTDGDSANSWDTNYENWLLSPQQFGGIEVLEQIKNARETGAQDLVLMQKNISNFSPLLQLPELRTLYLVENNLSDISQLSSARLTALHLINNNLPDLTVLKDFTELLFLELCGETNLQLEHLSELKTLISLDLSMNQNLNAFQKAMLEVNLPNTHIIWPDPWYQEWNQNLSRYGGFLTLYSIKQNKDNLYEVIYFSNNIIADISPLSELTHLKIVAIDENNVSDLTPLSFLENLQELYIYNNNISDLSPLSSLENLQVLSIQNSNISDLDPIKNLHKIKALGAGGNKIHDLSALNNFPDLEQLFLSDNNISDISPLFDLTKLKVLELASNKVPAKQRILLSEALPTALIYWEVKLSDWDVMYKTWLQDPQAYGGLEVLEKIQNLKENPHTDLDLSNSNIVDISPLAWLPFLKSVDLSDNNISDLSPLLGLSKLEHLDLSNNRITDTSPIAWLHLLKDLNLSDNDISVASPLLDLTKLEVLELASNEIPKNQQRLLNTALPSTLIYWEIKLSDWDEMYQTWIQDPQPYGGLEVLEKIQNLKENPHTDLDLSNSNIIDISPLAWLPFLKSVDLSDNNISDISPLLGLSKLEKLSLSNNSITDTSPLAWLPFLQSVDLSDNDISDISPLLSLANLEFINLASNEVPNNQQLILNEALTDTLVYWGIKLSDWDEMYQTWIQDPQPYGGLEVLEKIQNLKENPQADLDLNNSNIVDISPLAWLPFLKHLNLSDNDISDISPLLSLANLEFINLASNKVSNNHQLILEEALPSTRIHWEATKLDLAEAIKDAASVVEASLGKTDIKAIMAAAAVDVASVVEAVDGPDGPYYFSFQPVITLIGSSYVTHSVGSDYIDPGAIWNDPVGGSGKLVGVGEVEVWVPGIYTLTFDYTNSYGNAAATVIRTVAVGYFDEYQDKHRN